MDSPDLSYDSLPFVEVLVLRLMTDALSTVYKGCRVQGDLPFFAIRHRGKQALRSAHLLTKDETFIDISDRYRCGFS